MLEIPVIVNVSKFSEHFQHSCTIVGTPTQWFNAPLNSAVINSVVCSDPRMQRMFSVFTPSSQKSQTENNLMQFVH